MRLTDMTRMGMVCAGTALLLVVGAQTAHASTSLTGPVLAAPEPPDPDDTIAFVEDNSGGRAHWNGASDKNGQPNDGFRVCDMRIDGYGTRGKLYREGRFAPILVKEDNVDDGACAPWEVKDLPEGTKVGVQACLFRGNEETKCGPIKPGVA